MKKIFNLLMCLIMLFSVTCPKIMVVNAETETYDNQAIIKEVAFAYFRQGAQIQYEQYNNRRNLYASPEDATSERTIFLDCSSYVNSCYREAFGVNIMDKEIDKTISGSSPSTANYDAYAKNNPDNLDVVGHWVNADYTTEEEQKALLSEVKSMLEVGDLLCYRHCNSSGSYRGHVYIYIGDDAFLHCTGDSYTVVLDNPSASYDGSSDAEKSNGSISRVTAAKIFDNTDDYRYLFKNTTADTVTSFCVLRPLARGLTPTEETINRMKIAGLSMEKNASVYENSSICTDDTLTYTISLTNNNSTALSNVNISDTIPEGTEYQSGSEGVTVSNGTLSWTGNVPGNSTIKVTYNVKVTATTPSAVIESNATYVNGVKLGSIVHTVAGLNEAQRLLIAEKANDYIDESKSFEDGLSLARSLYNESLEVNLFDDDTVGSVLNQIIDEDNLTRYTDTELSKMVPPNLYGGYVIRTGYTYNVSEHNRTRLLSEGELAVGDIIVADWSGGDIVYVYVGNSTLVTIENGVCKKLTIGDEIYGEDADNILVSLLAYDRFAVLRPSMTNADAAISVKSIDVTTPPAKTVYGSGESFDPTGMVVTATLSDNTKRIITAYTVVPEVLAYPENNVTVKYGNLTASVNVSVAKGSVLLNSVENLTITNAAKSKVDTDESGVTTVTTNSTSGHPAVKIACTLNYHDGTDLSAARYAVISADVKILKQVAGNVKGTGVSITTDANLKYNPAEGTTFKYTVIADVVENKLYFYYDNTFKKVLNMAESNKLTGVLIKYEKACTNLGTGIDIMEISNAKAEIYSGYANLAGLQKAVESQIDYVPSSAEYDSVNKTYSIYVENIKYTAGTDVAYVAGYDASNKLIFAKEVTGGETYTIPSETVADSIKLFIWTKADLKPLFLTGSI